MKVCDCMVIITITVALAGVFILIRKHMLLNKYHYKQENGGERNARSCVGQCSFNAHETVPPIARLRIRPRDHL